MISTRLGQTLDLLDEVADVLEHRVHDPEPPAFCVRRGWGPFLLGLDESALARAESHGLASLITDSTVAPNSLRALCAQVRSATAVHTVTEAPDAALATGRRMSPRKRQQVAALTRLARDTLPVPRRVIDVGAGHGHLTRALARELSVPAVGLDHDGERVDVANALTDTAVHFEQWRGGDAPLALEAGDLLVGLHACGDLGDLIVDQAARQGTHALLVSCCLQKISGDFRRPRSRLGLARGFAPARPLLGLANLAARQRGVEGTMPEIMESRMTRYALRLLLRMRGAACAPGEEARGINRRRMGRGLGAVATAALAARGLPPAKEEELSAVEVRARAEFGAIRRLSLPRSMLGRVLELAIVLDRAAALEDAGHEARVLAPFSAAESPRNLAIVARR